MSKVYNFSAGPAILPREVLEEAQRELVDYQGTGMSIMEMSHRGPEYSAVHEEAGANLRALLGVPESHAVLFLQGGATGQFAMVPLNLRREGETADYANSGSWAKKAITEAQAFGKVHIAADTSKDKPARMPKNEDLKLTDGAAYLHITSNETISGAQWKNFPKTKLPLVADMSSDILSRPLNVADFGLIYAGAQKNLGPSGVTVVIIDKELAKRAPENVPEIWRYTTHIEADSLSNTPPTFAVYLVCLVTRWLKALGGVAAMQKRNDEKARKLYAAIDATDFYRGVTVPEFRSTMNVTFNLPTEELEKKFAKESEAAGLSGLKGHRSVGGLRASIYNAFPMEGIDALIDFMREFEKKNG